MPKLGEAWVELRADKAPLLQTLASSHRDVTSSAGRMARAFVAPFRAIASHGLQLAFGAAGAGAVLGKAIGAYADFERQMALVNTQLDEKSGKMLGTMGSRIREMATQFGEGTSTLGRGLYDILSAAIPAGKALDVLDVSARAAMGGMTTTAVAAKAITTALNAYQLDASKAGQISDVMFEAVRRGVMNCEELAGSLGDVVTMASLAGISFQELMANLATITRQGISASEATHAYGMLLQAIIDPQDDAAQLMRQLGIDASLYRVQQDGLNAVLRDMQGLSVQDLNTLAGRIRGFRAMATLIQDSKGREQDLAAMMRSSGAATAAFNKVAETTSTRLRRLKETAIDYLISGGERLVRTWDSVSASLGASFQAAWQSVGKIMSSNGFGGEFSRMAEGLKAALSNVLPWLQEQVARLPSYAARVGLEISAAIQQAFYGVEAWWNDFWGMARATVQGFAAFLGQTFKNTFAGIDPVGELMLEINREKNRGEATAGAWLKIFGAMGAETDPKKIEQNRARRAAEAGTSEADAFNRAYERALKDVNVPWARLDQKYPLTDSNKLQSARDELTRVGDQAAIGARLRQAWNGITPRLIEALKTPLGQTALKLVVGYPFGQQQRALTGPRQNVAPLGLSEDERKRQARLNARVGEIMERAANRQVWDPRTASGLMRWGLPRSADVFERQTNFLREIARNTADLLQARQAQAAEGVI